MYFIWDYYVSTDFNKDVHSSCWKSKYCPFVTSHRAKKNHYHFWRLQRRNATAALPGDFNGKRRQQRSDARSPLLAVLIPTVGLLRQSRRFHFPWHSETQRAAWRQDSPPPPSSAASLMSQGTLCDVREGGGGQLAKDVWRSFFCGSLLVVCCSLQYLFNP